jgi:D-glycero-D-manno-heptose 1,7-bisphosphate phosphatase
VFAPPRLVPAVFVDRDDTINENATLPDEAFPGTWGDLYTPAFVRLIPGAADACKRLRDNGFRVVVVTNQGGVARGHATLADIEATNARLCALVDEESGARNVIDAVYAGPHHPDAVTRGFGGDHPWRKPGPGMILTAAHELGLDLERSWMVGDKARDVECGRAAGLDQGRCLRVGPEGAFADLASAADYILSEIGVATASGERVTVRLRATAGHPLAVADTRETVESAARAIAERTGIGLLAVRADDTSVTATLATHRLAAMGFLSELRNVTNRWYKAKHPGRVLWPQAGADDDTGAPGDASDGDTR